MNELQRKLYNYILSAMRGHDLTIADLRIVTNQLEETYEEEAVLRHLDGHIKPLDSEP